MHPWVRKGPEEQRDRTYQVDHDVELDPGMPISNMSKIFHANVQTMMQQVLQTCLAAELGLMLSNDHLPEGAEDERSVLEAIYGNEFEILGPNEWRTHTMHPVGISTYAGLGFGRVGSVRILLIALLWLLHVFIGFGTRATGLFCPVLPVLLRQLFVSCSQQRVGILCHLWPDFPEGVRNLAVRCRLAILARASHLCHYSIAKVLAASSFILLGHGASVCEQASSPGASQGLRHAATEAVAELVENWQPPEEGEGCIYQSLSSSQSGLIRNDATQLNRCRAKQPIGTHRWVERLRECLEPALAAEVLQRDEQLGGC